MPELPEVQTTVTGIAHYCTGRSIVSVWTDYGSVAHRGKDNIKDPAYFKHFQKEVCGSTIVGTHRRGKNILIDLSNAKTIIIHMKMTGHIMYGSYRKLAKKDAQGESWRPKDVHDPILNDPFNRFIHLVFVLSDGKSLVMSDMRKFAKVTVTETATLHQSPHLVDHGPEPLDPSFTIESFKEALMKKPAGGIKQTLMDHQVISGIGNIYSDEILWRSGIHPLRKIYRIQKSEWPSLYTAMKETLRKGIDFGGDSMSDYRNILGERGSFQEQHTAYRKTGTPCSKRGCTGIIRRIKVGGRSAHFCDTHQI